MHASHNYMLLTAKLFKNSNEIFRVRLNYKLITGFSIISPSFDTQMVSQKIKMSYSIYSLIILFFTSLTFSKHVAFLI